MFVPPFLPLFHSHTHSLPPPSPSLQVLILHPIAAGLAGLAVIFGLIGVFSTSRIATILMTISSALALIVTLVAWVIDMVLFGIARNRINNAGGSAMYGNVSRACN